MTSPLYRDTGYQLTHLIEEIKHGNLALPDIQRPFVWTSAKVRDLFDSLYRGYPVGTLMFWETGAHVGTRQVGGGENEKVPQRLIVDGQQRLTSLFAVMTGRSVLTKKYETRRIRIAFRPADETFEVTDAAIEKDPEFIPDITALWQEGYKATVKKFLRRLVEARGAELSEAEDEAIDDRIDRVRDLQGFRFQVIELNSGADEEQVAEVFVRTNSEGISLNQSDFILTLMSVHWEKGRQQLEQFCRHAVDPTARGPSPRNAYIDPAPDQLLRAGVGLAFRRGRLRTVYNILRGKDLETGDVSEDRRAEQFDQLRRAQDEVLDLTNWREFLKCVSRAGFRSRRMVTSDTALIYTYLLWLIGRRDFSLDLRPLRGVISRWFFMAHTTGRYTSSPETRIEADLARIAALPVGDGDAFCAELDRLVAAEFTGDYWTISLPNELDTSASKSPALSAYWAALNVLGAELLFSDLRIADLFHPSVTAPLSVQQHHLYPKAHLAAQGITGTKQVNAIANRAFLDWPENVAIGAKDPQEYWPAMIEQMNPERLRRQEYWHALSLGWEKLDYASFLERRRDLIAQVVRDGFRRLAGEHVAVDAPSRLSDLLGDGESGTVEYKSTARWNLHTRKIDKVLEHVVSKTVCGFLNADGGTLLIGVADDGSILGLHEDLATFGGKSSRDGYELFLRQRLDNDLSISTAGVVTISFERVAADADDVAEDVCVVSVLPSGKAVFCKAHGGQFPTEFWVRVGNATKQLFGDKMVTYQESRFR